jgi:hypothetical protein
MFRKKSPEPVTLAGTTIIPRTHHERCLWEAVKQKRAQIDDAINVLRQEVRTHRTANK